MTLYWDNTSLQQIGIEVMASCQSTQKIESSHSVSQEPYVYPATVAVCTLADDALGEEIRQVLAQDESTAYIMVAPLRTENLGIEQIIEFCLGQPQLRHIVLCGTDARQCIGHLPGASFLALMEYGLDTQGRMINAPGKRPVIRNLTVDAVNHFRNNVSLIDFVDQRDASLVIEAVRQAVNNNTGPGESFPKEQPMKRAFNTLKGQSPANIVMDPAGYFVIEVDTANCGLELTHYLNSGELKTVVKGNTASDIYHGVIESGLITRLDHAAYLGKELTKSEYALKQGLDYIQDQAI